MKCSRRQVLAGFFKDNFNDRRFLTTAMFGRLKDGVSVAAAEASLKTLARHLESAYPKDNASRSVALTPLADAAVGVNNRTQIVLAGGMMMGIVGLVLLIACVNLANLLLAQAASRYIIIDACYTLDVDQLGIENDLTARNGGLRRRGGHGRPGVKRVEDRWRKLAVTRRY